MRRKKASFIDLLEYYFDTYLPVARGLSEKTIISYKATFRIFLEFLYTVKAIPSDKVDLESIDSQVITEFLDWLESERGCSVTTRNQRLSALSAFAIYAQNRDFNSAFNFRTNISKVPRKKTPRKGRASFTREEIKILFEILDADVVFHLLVPHLELQLGDETALFGHRSVGRAVVNQHHIRRTLQQTEKMVGIHLVLVKIVGQRLFAVKFVLEIEGQQRIVGDTFGKDALIH